MPFLDTALFYIQFQINKHGQYSGMTTPEEVVNTLSNYELLELIAEGIDRVMESQT